MRIRTLPPAVVVGPRYLVSEPTVRCDIASPRDFIPSARVLCDEQGQTLTQKVVQSIMRGRRPSPRVQRPR